MNDTQDPTLSNDSTTPAESAGDSAAAAPHESASTLPAATNDSASALAALLGGDLPALSSSDDAAPHVRILSNGTYWTAVSGGGSGFSQCGATAVTRWDGDRVADHDGVLVYLRDLDSGEVWSLGETPVGAVGGTFFSRTAPGVVTLGRRHSGIEATSEIAVAADTNVEMRRISLRTRAAAARRIEVTVYAEVIVGSRAADAAHPAFAKLFVETAFDAGTGVVTARRRPRGADESPQWAAATLLGDGTLELETDRARFLGRGRNVQSPAALASSASLSGSVGSVLDPVFALRRVVALEANSEASLVFAMASGASGEEASTSVASVARSCATEEGAKEFAKTAAGVERARRRRFGLVGDQAEIAQEIAGAMLYAHPALAATSEQRQGASSAASPKTALGIPADALLMVVPVSHQDAARVSAVLSVAGYLAELGLPVAVAALCEEADCSGETCPHRKAVAAASCRAVVASAAELGEQVVPTLLTQAHWVVSATPPVLGAAQSKGARKKSPRARIPKADDAPPVREKLQFDNGYGGFSKDGREYVVRVGPAALTSPEASVIPPMPWTNVIANERFGFLVSESGAGYTWAGNSRQNKLTPWGNDPVTDPHGEALYLRDHANGRFWSPLPGPAPSGAWCEARHGMGYTRWSQRSEAVEQEVSTYLAGDRAAKITRVRLSNRGSRERNLSVYSFAQLVLGEQPSQSSRFVTTTCDAASGLLFASNPMSEDQSTELTFAAVVSSAGGTVSWTTDRVAFLGHGGTMQAPQAVSDASPLEASSGAGVDPCFAFEVAVTLPPRGEVEVVFVLGQSADQARAAELVAELRAEGALDSELDKARDEWRDLVGAIEVQTPSKSLDLMLNGWLLYQALSCRIRGRSAYYQSGGAFGFRDQLQDSSALVYARPDLFRAQLLLHAGHQFAEGDVLHWWHPPANRGTRTRFSDDLLWLPYLATTYIGTTGDESVLDELVPFVSARALAEGEDEAYLTAAVTRETASVYEHCCLALDRSLTSGAHGLPLMGTGDWNDGMNRVGREGKGESVWMAFFLATILDAFLPIVEKRADWERLRTYREYRESLAAGIEASAWDGNWYRRAYYDNGAVLGSAQSDECRIDAIAQSWAVLSGVATGDRAKSAMNAVREHLVDEDAGIIRLLWPPFDRTPHDPGYIKGYVPGIRENGGQYSHAAMWVIRALARMGDRQSAMRLFDMVSPVTHGRDRAAADVYKVEPYVIAADIYGVEPHSGRGGWTWYTGSAAWMYRTGVESLLGLTIDEGRVLRIKPCIPDSWAGFRLKYRLPDGRTVYDIEVDNSAGCAASVVSASMGATQLSVDRAGVRLVLRRDGKVHKVKVVLG